MTEPMAYLNGQFLPQSQVGIPLHDAGFVFGATVTDLCRTMHQRLYRWKAHLFRFLESCHQVGITLPHTSEEITTIAKQIADYRLPLLQSDEEFCLVLFATPGAIPYYAGLPATESQATFGVHTFPLPLQRYASWLTDGAILRVPSVQHIPAASISPQIKQRSRLHWWLATQEVKQHDPQSNPLLLNEYDHLTETPAANFLLVRNDKVLSPRRETILNGVSLSIVESMCQKLHIGFKETDLTLNDCQDADEAMICGTAFCLAPVKQINEQQIPCPGPIFERLLQQWTADVGLDIRGQICNF